MEAIVNKKIQAVNVFKTAGITAAGLIAFFLVMKLLNFHTIVEFRFLNFFILLFGIRSILLSKRASEGGKLAYLDGLMLGSITGLTTSAIFMVFLFVFLNIDTNFMNYLMTTQPLGRFLTPVSTAMETMIEGTTSGVIITYLLINIINKDSDRG